MAQGKQHHAQGRHCRPAVFRQQRTQGGQLPQGEPGGHVRLDSLFRQGGGGGQLYALDGITCYDGWGNEFYYHSPAPYQSYRLWSAGENKRTFPPWISDEEISKLNGTDRTMVLNWLSDDIVKMKN